MTSNRTLLGRYLMSSFMIAFMCLMGSSPVAAHFEIGTTYRYFIVTEENGETEVYVRTPIALIFGDILSGAPDVDKYLLNPDEINNSPLFLSVNSVDASRASFSARLADSLQWKVGNNSISGRVRSYRILAHEPELHLLTSSAARESLSENSVAIDVPIGTGYIDMLISLPTSRYEGTLTASAGFPEVTLPDGVVIQNKIVDERDTANRIRYTRQGQLTRPLKFPRTLVKRMSEYVYQGVLHIFAGVDHILLVLAMALGTNKVWRLIGPVTAFTVGHAITLVAGFFNYVPQLSWFIPLVEMSIAATLVAASISGLLKRKSSLLIYLFIGLLHGLGFSFVLQNVLQIDATDLMPALFSFMIGIEIGQLTIICGILLAFYFLAKFIPRQADTLQKYSLISVGVAGCLMIIQRIPAVISS